MAYLKIISTYSTPRTEENYDNIMITDTLVEIRIGHFPYRSLQIIQLY